MDSRTVATATIAFISLLAQFTVAQQPSVRGDLGTAEHKLYPWHPDGLVAVIGDERGRIWDIAAGCGIDVRPDGKQLATGSANDKIYLWDAETLELERLLDGHEGRVLTVQYSPNGSLLTSCGIDKSIRVWELTADDPEEGAVVATLEKPAKRAAWSGNGDTLVFRGWHTEAFHIWHSTARAKWSESATIDMWQPESREIPEDIEQLAKQLDAKGISASSSLTHAVSADGDLLATASGGRIMWIVADDGNVGTTVESCTVVVWQIGGPEPKKLWAIEGVGYVGAMAFSPDGSLLAIGTHDRKVRTFSIAGELPEMLHEIMMPENIQGLCFDPRGETLAVAAGTVQLWNILGDVPAPGLEAPCAQRGFDPLEMMFSPDGRTLYYVDGAIVRRWDVARPFVEAGEGEGLLLSAVHSLSFSPDGTRVFAANERNGANKVSCWDFDRLLAVPNWEVDFADRRADDLTVSPDGRRFVVTAYKHPKYTLELWETTPDGPVKVDVADLEAGHPGSFWCTAFSPDGMTLASGHRDGTIRLWDTSGDRLVRLRTFANLHHLGVGGIDYAPDGNALAAVDWGGGVHVWQAAGDGLRKVPLDGRHSDRAYAVRFSPDGRLLVTGDYGGQILLWDVEGDQPRPVELAAHKANISSLDFSADGRRLLSAGQDGRVIVWDVFEKRILAEWRFPGCVNDAKFDPSGQYIATANGNGTLYVWRP